MIINWNILNIKKKDLDDYGLKSVNDYFLFFIF